LRPRGAGPGAVEVSQSAPDLLAQLHRIFGERLVGAAESLIDAGCVTDVRVLQAGSVVTGIAVAALADARPAKHRVYIQYRAVTDSAAGPNPEGECSCGERSPCVHIAAVSIAAALAHKPVMDSARSSALPSARGQHSASSTSGSPAPQHLYYLLEVRSADDARALERPSASALQVSAWVGHRVARRGEVEIEGACMFSPRLAPGSDFPRYVEAHDKDIIRTLTAQHFDSPWELSGEAGADVLKRAVRSGRAHWQKLRGQPLRSGPARQLACAWEILPNGDQRLRCQTSGGALILLGLEPVMYVDGVTGECGVADLPCAPGLLRQYCDRGPITPEQVADVNAQLMRDATGGAASLPRLQSLPIRTQARRSLRAKLLLSAHSAAPAAAGHQIIDVTLQLVYNDLPIDDRLLGAEQDHVRIVEHGTLCEIPRDHAAEQRLRAQLEHALPDNRQSASAWLGFMVGAVPALQADGWEIVTDDAFPYRIAGQQDWYADLQTAREDWFDLRLGAVVDGQRVNLLPALVSYLQGALGSNDGSCRVGEQLLVRLDDGRYLPVAIERIQRIADTLVELLEQDSLNKQQALSICAGEASRLAQLAHDLDGPALHSDDQSLLALVSNLENFRGIEPLPAPAGFRATLRSYQEEGLGWLQFLRRCHVGGILADDMGLGKTVQTLAHLLLEKAEGRLRKPSLIVAPVSVIGNWQQEIQRLAPELALVVWHGNRRKERAALLGKADIIVTGYPLLQLDSELLLACELYFLILDEAQTIKNPRAKVTQVARALQAEHRLCLTGTPMENHLGELWSLFNFVQPGLLGGQEQFQRRYRTPIEKHRDAKRAEALTRRIAPFVLRRTKDAVARELPPKTQIVESIVLDERQRDFYDGIRLAMHQRVLEAIQQQGLQHSQLTILDALLRLRQACCDPRLVNSDAQTQAVPSAKMDWLRTVLPELVAEGRRVLLFSQFTSMLALIEQAVTELAIPYCLLTGQTRERAALVERFQSGTVPLFLISLKAGGTGLNLTAADTVIHYDPWWNPAVEAQATDRAHRIGQLQPVFVYKLIAQGTVEEKIMQLQADKHALASQLYSERNATPGQLSSADLEALFAP
jgi:superfamily II DNA or RNA helicase